MSAVSKQKLTVSEYLVAERQAERKSEFFDGEVFLMAGASRAHNRINANLVGELFARLKGTECRAFSNDQRVLVEAIGLYTYPDVVIFCGPGTYDAADEDTLTNPVALIEVLSPSTERYDRGAKFRRYQQIPSLIEYVTVAQDEPVCERYVRQADGSWALVSFVGLTDILAFTSVEARIPLSDIYAGVVVPKSDRR
jgi:Uma2 family endonuclease